LCKSEILIEENFDQDSGNSQPLNLIANPHLSDFGNKTLVTLEELEIEIQ